MSLSEQVAIVTGASRGIGKAIAIRLASQGAIVAGISRSVESSKSTLEAIEAAGGKFFPYAVDVTSEQAVTAAADAIAEKFGRIDILVNNAGITRDTLLLRMTADDWNQVIQTNLTGAFYWSKPVSRHMMKSRRGRLINIGSIVGLKGNAGQANYAAAKAGIIGFSKSLARELAPRNITCNVICPGFIDTDMTSVLSDEIKKKVLAEIPLKRFGKPEDIAACVAYLASDEGSYITGQIFTIDGGLAI